MKRALFFLVMFLVVAAGLGWLLYVGVIRFNNPGRAAYPVRGIDVSHHQGAIDWRTVRTADVSFAFMKATEGADFRDPRFEENWRAAGETGIVRGAYHYFTFCTPGREQAENFKATVPLEAGVLPPVVDVEFSGNCRARPSVETIRGWLGDYLLEIESAYRRKPILYITQHSFDRIVGGNFPGYPLWVRSIYFRPSREVRDDWLFWQYADRGRVAGIDGFVDLNVFNGGPEQFRAFLERPPGQLREIR